MKHTVIIQRVIEAVGLDDGMPKGQFAPSEAKPLVKDDNYEPQSGMYRCSSVVQMPLYLSRNTCPDVSLVMNGCYQYMFSPKKYHELSLKIFVHYFKQTKNCGLVLDTNSDVCKVDSHPYAVFSCMYVHDNNTYPVCVKIHTVFIITFSYYTILWVSKLQTKSTLLTMEVEIIAMDHCCRSLFPTIYIDTSLGK